MHKYIYTFHTTGGDWVEVYAENRDEADKLAEQEGVSFETCETCGDSMWIFVAEITEV